jgi:hypothetical protein
MMLCDPQALTNRGEVRNPGGKADSWTIATGASVREKKEWHLVRPHGSHLCIPLVFQQPLHIFKLYFARGFLTAVVGHDIGS